MLQPKMHMPFRLRLLIPQLFNQMLWQLQICSDADTCTKCNENFYLTDEHTVSCPDFCKEWHNDKATPEVSTC